MTTAVRTARWELIRAVGAAIVTPPPASAAVFGALDLPEQSAVDYTTTFVLSLPPHAAIYLGPEGKLGGEGLDRVAGFWRALGLRAPEDADQLGVLLMLYAQLGEAREASTDERVRAWMATARAALFDEHIWSWAPAYLAAVARLGVASTAAWAELAADVIRHERETLPEPGRLPLALRVAPSVPVSADDKDELLDVLVAPARSGVIVSQRDLEVCARSLGIGFRRGERRFAIKAMLEQDPTGTLSWFAGFARDWSRRHSAGRRDRTGQWWAARAAALADHLDGVTHP
jgi:TorA maturation chaperone TorD